LEKEVFGGGELFYQPLKDFLKNKGIEELEKIPNGVFSGLKKNKISGIFFYYKYGEDFHFWYLYDIKSGTMLTRKTEIFRLYKVRNFNEPRVIPDFFERVYEANKLILENIERTYKEIVLSQTQDSQLKELNRSKSTKFIKTLIDEIELQIDDYLKDYPNDTSVEQIWEHIKTKLISLPQTKKDFRNLERYG